jgi:hypothetical protein
MKRRRKETGEGDFLPGELKPIFWEYDFSRLRWERDRDLIIGRILSQGDWWALQWLRRRVDSVGLRSWLSRKRGAGLSSPQLRFWELLLELPHREVNGWLKDKGRGVWEMRARE